MQLLLYSSVFVVVLIFPRPELGVVDVGLKEVVFFNLQVLDHVTVLLNAVVVLSG